MKNKKIAYILNHSTFFSSHILPHACAARSKGFKIKLFCGKYSSKSMNKDGLNLIKKKKINFETFNFDSSSLNLFSEIFIFFKLLKSIRKFNPDIIHVATPKGQVFGGLISKILKTKGLVIFISGMGYLFSNNLNLFEVLMKNVFVLVQKFILSHPNKVVIIENKSDKNFFRKKFYLNLKHLSLIDGSGVNLKKFKKIKNIKKNKIILFAGRALKEKGIYEFTEAATVLKKKYQNWKFVVAGATDYSKPSKVSDKLIKKYSNKKIVEFIGYKKNIYDIYKKTGILCLPSYREGLSKTLCEAAACGIPIVTSDVVGCKDAIINKKTGELCKSRDIESLKKKIEILIKNPELRVFYGKNGHMLAKKKFNIDNITNKILSIYKKLLNA